MPDDDPAFKKALVFVSRCQNLKSEHNDQPWAGKINDGSFIYIRGRRRPDQDVATTRRPTLPGYGSMTYAGVKSMIYCGVGKDDPRFKKAFAWLQGTTPSRPTPACRGELCQRGLYYYYHTMAKTLDVARRGRRSTTPTARSTTGGPT